MKKYMISSIDAPSIVDTAKESGFDVHVHLHGYSGTAVFKPRSGEETTDWEFMSGLADDAHERFTEKMRQNIAVSVEEIEDGCEDGRFN